MSTAFDITKKEEEDKIAPKLRLITGGKGPPTYNEGDWLSPIEEETTILIQKINDQNVSLGQATVVMKLTKAILLTIVGQSKEIVWVDPNRFCSIYRRYDTVQTAQEAQEERQIHDVVTEDCMANGHIPQELRPLNDDSHWPNTEE